MDTQVDACEAQLIVSCFKILHNFLFFFLSLLCTVILFEVFLPFILASIWHRGLVMSPPYCFGLRLFFSSTSSTLWVNIVCVCVRAERVLCLYIYSPLWFSCFGRFASYAVCFWRQNGVWMMLVFAFWIRSNRRYIISIQRYRISWLVCIMFALIRSVCQEIELLTRLQWKTELEAAYGEGAYTSGTCISHHFKLLSTWFPLCSSALGGWNWSAS